MLTLLSPAKKLLNISKPWNDVTSKPLFMKKTIELARIMKSKSIDEIAMLMDLSEDLALLNFNRFQHFNLQENLPERSCPALFLFQGDVYQGLLASSWDKDTVHFSQSHLGILSGLYGLLKPLDRIQPYRLEMGVRLTNPCGETLYDFWRTTLTNALNQQLYRQKNPILVNLASREYFKVIDEKKLDYPVITVNFYEKKNNEIKIIGILAKKARGAMARFLMQNQIDDLTSLKKFNELGYQLQEGSISEREINFIRVSK